MEDAEAESPAAPDRSRRIYVLWGAGFAFLAALAAFCWLVVGPVVEVGRVIGSYHIPSSCLIGGEGELLVEELGGPERASRKLALYLRASALTGRDFGGSRESAAVLLGHCGKWGLVRIIPMLESKDGTVQDEGYIGMAGFFHAPVDDVTTSDANREKALRDLDPEMRALATKALASLDAMLRNLRAGGDPKR